MHGSNEDITQFIGDLDTTREKIFEQITDIAYHMKGGVTWDQAWALSHLERKHIIKIVNKKMKQMSGDTREYF